MPLSDRENYLRTMKKTGKPEWMPCNVYVNDASLDLYRAEMEEVMERHPLFFPGFKKGQRDYDNFDYGPAKRKGERYTDSWGCTWITDVNGLEGQVVGHPLESWDAMDSWQVPDPNVTHDRGPANWAETRKNVENARKEGRLIEGGVPHGFLFMRLWYLRGFENLMVDVASNEPRLEKLIEKINRHNELLIKLQLDIGMDQINFGEDLGTQKASFISPKSFARWVTPNYKRYFQPIKAAGALVFLHCDGHIMDIMDELIESGVDIINPQDRLNGIDNLAKYVKGRINIRLDFDRQKTYPFGTRKEIFDLVEEEVRKLGSPRGGLSMVAGTYPPTPPENLDAICRAIEHFRTWWWDGRGG